jgi:hypothetical protein
MTGDGYTAAACAKRLLMRLLWQLGRAGGGGGRFAVAREQYQVRLDGTAARPALLRR